MKTVSDLILALCLLLPLMGCTLHPPQVGEKGPSVPSAAEEAAYQQTLERYTDHAEVYDLLDTRLFTAVTYQSWPFRQARVQRMATFQVQPQPLVEKNLAA